MQSQVRRTRLGEILVYFNFPINFLIEDIRSTPYGHFNYEKIDKEILEFKESLKDMDFINIAKPSGVKKIKKYTGRPASVDCIFSEFENKAPVTVKAAVRYNDLLKSQTFQKKLQTP